MAMGGLPFGALRIACVQNLDCRLALKLGRQDHATHKAGLWMIGAGRGAHGRVGRLEPMIIRLRRKAVIIGLQMQLPMAQIAKARARMHMAIGHGVGRESHFIQPQQGRSLGQIQRFLRLWLAGSGPQGKDQQHSAICASGDRLRRLDQPAFAHLCRITRPGQHKTRAAAAGQGLRLIWGQRKVKHRQLGHIGLSAAHKGRGDV